MSGAKKPESIEELTSPSQPADGEPGGVESVDRIRDIIFGAQMRDYEARFLQLEQRLVNEASNLRKDLKDRFDRLEELVTDRVADVSESLNQEESVRKKDVQGLAGALKETEKSITERMENQGGDTGRALKNLQSDLDSKVSQLNQELTTAINQLNQSLTSEVRQLRHDKTDRLALAEVLKEAASTLAASPKSDAGSETAGKPRAKTVKGQKKGR